MNTAMHQAVLEAGADPPASGNSGRRRGAGYGAAVCRPSAPPVVRLPRLRGRRRDHGRRYQRRVGRLASLAEEAGVLASGDIYTLRRIVPKDRGLQW